MFRKTKVCSGLMLAFGGSLALGALPAHAQQQLERVEITGSAIKRVNQEGPAPVEIITRKDIAKTGATTVNELIRSIPSMDIFDQGELASNSPVGSGTANIGMRGLAVDNTLILLNGRRVPVNALYDSSGAGAAFDINTIPLSIVERVEVLKDGGSAIYGADAVAGVINIITKTEVKGFNVSAGYGQSSRHDAKEKSASISGGFGDLSTNRYNVAFGVDMFKRDPILRKDRDLTKSVDFRSWGSSDARSGFAPTGNVVDPNTGDYVGLTYKPCPPENFNVVCRYDFNQSLLTSYNGADRISAFGQGSFMVTPDTRVFLELMAAKTKDHFDAHPVPDYFLVPIIDPAQTPYEDPANPGSIYITGRFMQGGPRTTDRVSKLFNVVTGAEGTIGNIDWKFNIGQGTSKVTNTDGNYYNKTLWTAATNSGALDPTISTNDPAFVDSLKVTPVREGKSTLRYLNFSLSGDAAKLPAGMLRYAVGGSVARETLSDRPDALSQAGLVVGSIQQAAVEASRTTKGVFGELSIPILRNLEAQAALRYDKYPSESKTSPKVAFKYQAIPQFAVRGSYSESFKAPVLKQLYGAQEEGAITITSDAQCALLGLPTPCLVNAYQVNGSNPNLVAEKGKTYNLGFVFEPNQTFNASLDFWKIKKKDDISSPTITTALEQGLFEVRSARYYIYTNLQNLAQRVNQGVDLDARLRFPGTAMGSIVFQNMLTYYDSQKRQDSATDPLKEYVGTYAVPRWRNRFSASTTFGPWTVTGVLRSVAGFYDSDQELPIAMQERKVGKYDEFDLQAQFMGIKGLTITGGIKNVFDRMPPFSAQNATDNTYTQMGFAELYNVRGRFFYANVSYSFE
ncbi:MAG: TonB-dependent receptor [Rhizobacter sp.]|nr:TonB-dependent receptor [Rhizobacter sp.]